MIRPGPGTYPKTISSKIANHKKARYARREGTGNNRLPRGWNRLQNIKD